MAAPPQQMPSTLMSMEKGQKTHSLCRVLFPSPIAQPVRPNVSQENTVRNYLQQMMNLVNDLL